MNGGGDDADGMRDADANIEAPKVTEVVKTKEASRSPRKKTNRLILRDNIVGLFCNTDATATASTCHHRHLNNSNNFDRYREKHDDRHNNANAYHCHHHHHHHNKLIH